MCESGGLSESCEQAIRAELNRLLESDAFRTSKRCREFLAYIVEHTISGPSGTLKERSIGVDLFQLPHDFDTSQHTIVRVTASEVRRKLAQYYLAENGSYHPVKIDLPPGSYSAEFKWETPPAETPVPPVSPGWLTRRLIAYVIAVFVIAGAFFLWREHAVKPTFFTAKSTPVPEPVPAASLDSTNLRMIVGSGDSYIDRSGRTWEPDRFFSGGSVLVRPSERIFRTLDPDIYRHIRQGDFRYDIPLKPGSYELHLLFAETGLAAIPFR
jgi:malectin (di-glucose binding ER protein)